MTIGALIQARMSSKRLPGKVLYPIVIKPLLLYTLERLQKVSDFDDIVVCTSTDLTDDKIEAFCQSQKQSCFRGSLTNVTQRFREALLNYGFDYFVRICGDSPFIDRELVTTAIKLMKQKSVDMVTNVFPRSFPKGQSVEVFQSRCFLDNLAHMTQAADQEHVSPYFYRNANRFRIHNFAADADYSQKQLQVDTPEDMAIAERMIRGFSKPHWQYTWKELIGLKATILDTLRKDN